MLIFALIFSAVLAQDLSPKPMAAPSLPFADWDACPFEGCGYHEWTARREVVVYNSREEPRHEIARLEPGEKATGITGVVVTIKPGIIRIDRDLPLQHFKAGDILLTYAYRGEGYAAVWFKGNYYANYDISFARNPDGSGCGNEHCAATYVDLGEKEWWAQVRLANGFFGWVRMNTTEGDNTSLLDLY